MIFTIEVKGNQCGLDQFGSRVEQQHAFLSRSRICQTQIVSFVKPLHRVREVDPDEIAFKDLAGRALDQILGDAMGADLLAFIFQLHLTGHRRNSRIDVRDARHNPLFAGQERAAFSVGNNRFHYRDWQPLRDTRMFVDALIVAGFESNLFDCFADKFGNQQTILETVARSPGFLPRDLDAQADLLRIVRHDLRADAIL